MASYYKPVDAKREEFRKYLDRAGVMDTVTKGLVSLYEEQERPDPSDALNYMIKAIGGSTKEEIEATKVELNSYLEQIRDFETEIEQIKALNAEAAADEGAGGDEECVDPPKKK